MAATNNIEVTIPEIADTSVIKFGSDIIKRFGDVLWLKVMILMWSEQQNASALVLILYMKTLENTAFSLSYLILRILSEQVGHWLT